MKLTTIIAVSIFLAVILILPLVLAVYLITSAVGDGSKNPLTFEQIIESAELTVITRNNAHCYYQYRDEPMGFEYELAKAFAEYLGVRLNIIIAEKWEGMTPDLKKGKGSIIAASMTVTEKRKRQIAFSDAYMKIRQYIIVNRENAHIKTIEDLNGRAVHVRRGTSYHERLMELKRSGVALKLVLHDDIPTEELIRQVSEGEIDITIADTNVALLNQRYYPNVIRTGAISDTQYIAWAVHPRAKKLRAKINAFFRAIRADGRFSKIYNRYYRDAGLFDYVDLWAYHRRLDTLMPRYELIIKNASERYGFDWRLVTAQIYQESHFKRWAQSHAGAYGLMQLTHSTAKALGVKDIFNPEENIHAGVRHLKFLYDYFDQVEGEDRLYIALAAYNIGQGHVKDAQKLAARMDLDPDKWNSLEKILPLLKQKKYYRKTEFGYCRGDEPVKYVQQIKIYYDILKRQAFEYEVVKGKM